MKIGVVLSPREAPRYIVNIQLHVYSCACALFYVLSIRERAASHLTKKAPYLRKLKEYHESLGIISM